MSGAPKTRPARGAPAAGGSGVTAHGVGLALRARLHQVEVRIGLLAEPDPIGAGNRFRGATLLPANADAPAAFATLFANELAEIGRLGHATGRCHGVTLAPYRVLCLPYFTFDGFNALLAVEEGGDFLVAWQDREAHPALYPREIHLCGPQPGLERFLARALRPAT